MPKLNRADAYNVTVTVAGHQFGTMDAQTGGAVDSDVNTIRRGNMGEPESLGGHRSVENIVVRVVYDDEWHSWSEMLISSAGKAPMLVVKMPLDINGKPFGKPITYRGTLKRVSFPEHDAQSSDAGFLELEMIVVGFPSGQVHVAA